VLGITFLRCLYFLLLIPLTLYGLSTTYLLYVYLRHVKREQATPDPEPLTNDASCPLVAVQLPLYNERYVARRVIAAVADLDYPKEKLHIQVLDDSTDDTTSLIEDQVQELREKGHHIDLIHREVRTGYKGGALANGFLHTDSEFIVVFDADFIPPRDFLRRTIPYFYQDPRIGVVQARWGHLNDDDNLVTRSQALMLDCHFAVEQFARSQGGLIVTFNGTGGIWRRQAIEDAGGWAPDTLAEDQDLSYRAQIKGWRFIFLRDVVIPGELPPQMNGYRQQQARWSKGTTQVLLKVGQPLLRSHLTIRQRIMGFLHLFTYPSQLMSLLLLVLMPFLIATNALNDLPLAPLGLVTLSIPFLYTLGQAALYPNWLVRSLYFPVLLVFSSGMTLSNSLAVLSALRGQPSEFKRTPKYRRESDSKEKNATWLATSYAAFLDKKVIWEILFGFYATFGMLLAWNFSPSLLVYFLIYTIGFFSVAGWSVGEYWLAVRAARQNTQKPGVA